MQPTLFHRMDKKKKKKKTPEKESDGTTLYPGNK